METFGGELKFFGIGGSKLDGTVEQFLREAKFPYAIGYGLTETAPMAAGSNPSQTFLQGVGPVMEGVQIKINNPDKSGQGEIWIKGPNVMKDTTNVRNSLRKPSRKTVGSKRETWVLSTRRID